tara:strand:- start:5 stop:610 length:606 start_codon:yes stop_codon:yes gene_type:complete
MVETRPPQSITASNKYRYSRRSLMGDFVRASIGQLFFGLPMIFADLGPVMLGIFGGFALFFFAYGIHVIKEKWTTFEFDEKGVTRRGLFEKRLKWDRLRSVKLYYFTTSKDRPQAGTVLDKGSWMELTIEADSQKLKFDSALEGFTQIAYEIETKANMLHVQLDPSTSANFRALRGDFATAHEEDPRSKTPYADKYRDLGL